MKDKVTVIIPCKNEEKSLKDIITKCQRHSDDVFVVDGHSKDRTIDDFK